MEIDDEDPPSSHIIFGQESEVDTSGMSGRLSPLGLTSAVATSLDTIDSNSEAESTPSPISFGTRAELLRYQAGRTLTGENRVQDQ